jgi:hypothetical protein
MPWIMIVSLGLPLTLFLTLFALPVASANDLIQACVKPTGDVLLIGEGSQRQACRAREVLVEWLAGFGLESRVTALEDQVAALEGQTAAHEARITQAENAIGGLGTRTTELESTVNALDARVTALEPPQPGSLVIVDSLHNVVGPVSNFTLPERPTLGVAFPPSLNIRHALTVLRIHGIPTLVSVTPEKILGASTGIRIRFLDSNCESTPLIELPNEPGPGWVEPAYAAANGEVFYIRDRSKPVVTGVELALIDLASPDLCISVAERLT